MARGRTGLEARWAGATLATCVLAHTAMKEAGISELHAPEMPGVAHRFRMRKWAILQVASVAPACPAATRPWPS